jgi:hypothetical protein
MRKSAAVGIVLAALVAAGCSELSSPTSPSTTIAAAATSAAPGTSTPTLHWNIIAPGCTPVHPAPEVEGPPAHVRQMTPDELHFHPGAVLALWMRAGGDSVWGIFHPGDSGHALCFWDTAGL